MLLECKSFNNNFNLDIINNIDYYYIYQQYNCDTNIFFIFPTLNFKGLIY